MKNQSLKFVKSDCYRYTGKTNLKTMLLLYIKSSTFRWQVAFRLVHGSGITRILGEIVWYLNTSRQRIQIEKRTTIGYGLYIAHGGPIVVNSSATIGNNCNLSQFTTIGANGGEKAATIGDNVYIGPGVCCVDSVIIGNNVTIGAGSVVTKDIPDDATAVGNYAHVINYNNPGRYIKNRWNSGNVEHP